jgi:16S rRNA (cytosine1402-N4)-methyltransferase
VLGPEVVSLLVTDPGGVYVDATLGGGGHAELILDSLDATGRLIGLDRDPAAVAYASARLARFGPRLSVVQASFGALPAVLDGAGIDTITGVLFDLGVSSRQIDDATRGFSYSQDGPLDMRMAPDAPRTAADVVNASPEADLLRILRDYGEERAAGRIVRAIAARRQEAPILRTLELAEIVARAAGGRFAHKALARVFQAIRIEVNEELATLRESLQAAAGRLSPGGRLGVLAYHSLEDRIVKQVIRGPRPDLPRGFPAPAPTAGLLREVNRGGTAAGPDETARNPRARSARLRVAERKAG